MEEYLDVHRREGGTYLETYHTPDLTWDEVKALKVGRCKLDPGLKAPPGFKL